MAYYNQPFAVKLFMSLMTCMLVRLFIIIDIFRFTRKQNYRSLFPLGNRSSAGLTVVSVLWILDN